MSAKAPAKKPAATGDSPSSFNLGSLMKRKSTKTPQNLPRKVTASVGGSSSAERRARDLEKELSETKLLVEEKEGIMKKKLAEKDAAVEALEAKLNAMIEKNAALSKQLAEKDETLKLRDEKIVSQKKFRPVSSVLRTAFLVGSGAVVALASCGGEEEPAPVTEAPMFRG